jgi:hypothetical protein
MATFTQRMIGAAKLDAATYEEVEHDTGSTGQAAGVVVLSSLAAGIGSIAYAGFWSGLVFGTVAALIGWVIWAGLTWLIGTKLLPEAGTEADMGQLMRTIGFSASPGVLRIGGIIPGIGPLIVFAASVWMLAAMVVAVRAALDYTSTWRAVGVCVIGWLVLLAVQALLFAFIGAPPPA